jgi:hypothetical protein
MITLTTPTDLKVLAVLVPIDAEDFYPCLTSNRLEYFVQGHYSNIWIPIETFVMIGTLHMDNGLPVFSEGFDFSPFLKEESYADSMRRMAHTTNEEYVYSWLTVELPRQADRYLVNPMGDRPIRRVPFMAAGFETDRDREALAECDEQLYSWRAAEEKAIKDKLVFVL